jgi:hypothetical protein
MLTAPLFAPEVARQRAEDLRTQARRSRRWARGRPVRTAKAREAVPRLAAPELPAFEGKPA